MVSATLLTSNVVGRAAGATQRTMMKVQIVV
jgi:hypothetical protein